MDERKYKLVAKNRKAWHDFEILQTYEAGIALVGTEVKSLRQGKIQLNDSHARFENNVLILFNMHISPYERGNINNHDPLRPRKLLMHKRELDKLFSKIAERGLTLVPLKVYFSGKYAKVELGLARGKQLHDKRDAIAKRDAQREIDRKLKEQ